MQDGIIKGTGNSRLLKGAGWPATYAEFKAMAEAGTLPIDLAGINADGWQQLATALSKGNLLSDATAALINTLVGSTPSTPDAALAAITGKAQTLYNGRVQIATGSYTGTGTYGSANKNTLVFQFTPKIVIIVPEFLSYSNANAAFSYYGIFINGAGAARTDLSLGNSLGVSLTWGSNSVSWYSNSNVAQLNSNNTDNLKCYRYIAIG